VRNALWAVLILGGASPLAVAQTASEPPSPPTGQQVAAELLARPHIDLGVLLETGAKLAEQELYEPARAIFTRGVNDYPSSFEARYNLALADFALGRFGEARAALNGADQLPKDQALAREYLSGKIFDALGEKEAAERSLSLAFRGAPEEENYALDLGLHYLRQRSYANAIATFQTATKYHADSIFVGLGLGLAQALGDDPPRAVATCRKILASDPNFAPARLLLAAVLYMSGENELCARETASAIERPGAHPYLYYLHAASLIKTNSKNYAAMLKDLDVASRSIPGCAFCYFTESKVHQELGDDAAAIADLEFLVNRVDPEFSQGWYRLANLYQHSGRLDDAARALARFRAIRTAQTDREAEYLRKVLLDALK
jgi:tetratricopeptide (TPR) repeat protein